MNTLPMRDGVSASKLYLPKLNPQPVSLYAYLCQKFPHISPDAWYYRLTNKHVFSAQGTVLNIDAPYQYGSEIYYYRFIANEIPVPFSHEIIFENDHIIVVDKPHFLTVSPAGNYVHQTLLTRLKMATGDDKITPIHRLDRDTAGLILFSKNTDSRHLYQALFAKRDIHKIYHAIAPINPKLSLPLNLSLHLTRGEPFYTMRIDHHKVANTHTLINIIDVKDGFAKYELQPTTGKLHQLRVCMAYLGIAIKNDPYYPCICHRADDDFSTPLQLLAKSLSFIDPISGMPLRFYSNRELIL